MVTIRKLKVKSRAGNQRLIPFDTACILRAADEAEIPKIFDYAFVIKPQENLRNAINELPLNSFQEYGATRAHDKKTSWAAGSLKCVGEVGRVEDGDVIVVRARTRATRNGAVPAYMVSKSTVITMNRNAEMLTKYSMQPQMTPGQKEFADGVRLLVGGKYEVPCTMCRNGLLKFSNFRHCMLGTSQCLENIQFLRQNTFTAKAEAGSTSAATETTI